MSTITFDFRHYYRKGERRESDQIAYQWDLGHVAEIYVPVNATYEIHYCFADFMETDDYAVESTTAAEDGGYKLTAHIPNKYFERSGELKVYVIGSDDNHVLTTYEGYISIRGRIKPDDYTDDDPENEATRILAEAREARDAAIEAAEQAEAAASQSAAQASIAEVYDATKTYAIGDYCLHDGQLYECTAEITTPEAWAAAHWTAATVGTELNDIKGDVTGLKEDLTMAMDGISEQGAEITGGIVAFDKTGKTITQIAISDTSATTADIIRCGKNICPKFSSGSGNGLSWVVASDGTITFTGTPTADTFLRIYNQNIPFRNGEKKTLAFFNNKADTNNKLSFFMITSAGNDQVNMDTTDKVNVITHSSNATCTELRLRIPANFDATGLIIKPMIVIGEVDIQQFEEYNGQTFSVTVDDGVVQSGSITYLDGVNTIWSSVGDITVTYDQVGNIKEYVDEQFAAVSLLLEPRIQSNETAIAELNADVDSINTKLDEMIPSESYTGTFIAEEFSGSQFESIEIDTTDTSADLYVCGKNIFPKFPSGSANGLTWTVADDGTISFTGTPTADTLLRLQNLYLPVENVECSFAFFNNMTNSRLSFFGVNASNTQNDQLNFSTVNTIGSLVPTINFVELRLRIPKDVDWTGLVIRPMMVVGSEAGEFEEYKGGKTAVTLTDGKVNEQIYAFSGTNTIWSNKGNITVTATSGDLIDYINNNLDAIRYSGGFYKFTQSNNASYLNIYFKSGENFIGYELHNVPAPASNSNTWQLGHTVAYKFDGTNLSDAVELIEGGEYELAMRENGAADYCGGNNHGDENTVTFKLFIDGEQITDLSAFATGEYKTFNRIDAFDISLVDRCTDGGGTAGDYIARHQKHWTFEGGKVEVQQSLKFLQNLRLDVVLLCMCCAKRSQFPYGIRQGAVEIEDMSTSGFPHITTRGNDVSYFYFGNNATINIKAKTDSPTQSALYINSTVTQNKLYYGYYQATNSANPTEVTEGTVIKETSLYDVAYN